MERDSPRLGRLDIRLKQSCQRSKISYPKPCVDNIFENFEIFKDESTETRDGRNVGSALLYRFIASILAEIHSLARADAKCVTDMMI